MDGQKARYAAATHIFRTHSMARPLWCHHQAINIGTRFNQIEMHIQPVGKSNRRTGTDIAVNVITVDIGLQFIRCQHHDEITPGSGLGNIHDFKAGISRLGAARRIRTQRNRNIGNAAILQVGSMGMTLATVTYDHNFLLFDQANVGVSIVIDSHGMCSP